MINKKSVRILKNPVTIAGFFRMVMYKPKQKIL